MINIESNMFLTFKIGSHTYGIEFTKIKEILTYNNIIEIPDVKPWVKGVIDVRGNAVAVVDLRVRFGLNVNTPYNDKTVFIAAKVNADKVLAYTVDSVETIETAKLSDILPPNRDGIIDPEFLKGYFRTANNELVIILNMDKIIAAEEMDRLLINDATYNI